MNVYVTAPTGIAAINVNGITFHRLCRMGLCTGSVDTITSTIIKRPDLRDQWLGMDTLIIDEVSMMDISLFIRVGTAVGQVRYTHDKCDRLIPFGGIQLIVVGDFYQLPPIQAHVEDHMGVDGEIKNVYKYLFQHKVWKDLTFNPIVLTRPMRFMSLSDADDPVVSEQRESILFAEILGDVRVGLLSDRVVRMMEERSVKPVARLVKDGDGRE